MTVRGAHPVRVLPGADLHGIVLEGIFVLGIVLLAAPQPLRGNDVLLRERIVFTVPLRVPRLDRLSTTIPIDDSVVSVEAQLRFDRKGRVACDEICSVDGVPVTARGTIRRQGDEWRYRIKFRSRTSPAIQVRVSGVHGLTRGRVSYSGPKGKRTIKDHLVIVSSTSSTFPPTLTLRPSVSPVGKISGTGEFPEGFGQTLNRNGKLRGRVVGDLLTWTLKSRGRKISFEGFRRGEVFQGTLRVQMRPEKMAWPDFSFPETEAGVVLEPVSLIEQKPFVLRFQFQLVSNQTGELITPRDGRDNLPTDEDFHILEDGVLIDPAETNQFLSPGSLNQLDAVLILDYTGSMASSGSIPAIVTAATAFIDTQGENTHLALMAFWERQGGFGFIRDYTRCDRIGRRLLKEALAGFEAPENGASELWDTVDRALGSFPVGPDHVTRAVVFLSDGRDTSSTTTVTDLVSKARARGVNIYPLGFHLASGQNPEAEQNLEFLAAETAGVFFTIEESSNGESELGRLFQLVTKELSGEWILSYVTLKTGGDHTVTVRSVFEDSELTFTKSFTVGAKLIGNIRVGLLSLRELPSSDAGSTQYVVIADYVPRGIEQFRIRIDSKEDAHEFVLPEEEGLTSAAEGWQISDPDEEGRYLLSGPELRYGAFGALARVIVHADKPNLLVEVDDSIYTGKSFVFSDTGNRSISTR